MTDLSSLTAQQRLALYGAMFALAAIDGAMDKDEINAIYETLDLDGLSEAQQLTVRGYLVEPPAFAACLEPLAELDEAMRFGVLVMLTEIALADEVVTPEERSALEAARETLRATEAQLAATETFVREARRIRERGLDDSVAAEALMTAASGMTAVGIPIAAVYFSGSVVGLSAAGITSGLAALGIGFGMVPGIGVAILIGTATYFGVRKLLRWSRDNKESVLQADRERRAQLVVQNLQATIDMLVGRISELQDKGRQADQNAAVIAELTRRLRALKSLLAKRAGAAPT